MTAKSVDGKKFGRDGRSSEKIKLAPGEKITKVIYRLK